MTTSPVECQFVYTNTRIITINQIQTSFGKGSHNLVVVVVVNLWNICVIQNHTALRVICAVLSSKSAMMISSKAFVK